MLFQLRQNVKTYLSNLYLSEFDKILKHQFKFHYATIDTIDQLDCTLSDLYEGREDGVIINGFISSDEIRCILDNLNRKKGFHHKIRFGHTFGITLSDSDQQKYFRYASLFLPALYEVAGKSILERLEYCFASLTNLPCEIARNKNGELAVPATIRTLYPGKGGLPIHCERATTTDIDPISTGITDLFYRRNILSYFVVLQNASKGGSLILFNSTDYRPGMGLKSVSDIFLLKGQKFKPEPGDLLIFNGGSIWHKVEDIKGKNDRITMAGFLDLNKDRSKWIFWS